MSLTSLLGGGRTSGLSYLTCGTKRQVGIVGAVTIAKSPTVGLKQWETDVPTQSRPLFYLATSLPI